MQDNKELTYDDFLEKYTPLNNHFCRTAAHDGCMFETFGHELDFVRACDPQHVWTLIDNNDGWYGVSAGLHFVNRIGYLITEEEWQDGTEEFTICDEGPVNDWFNDLEVEEQKKVFGDRDLRINKLLNIGDQLQDTWNDLCVDEKEELMENYKNQNNGL